MLIRLASYSDGQEGRCAIGVIMSYLGWNGKDEPGSAQTLLAAFDNMKSMKAYWI
jgi:hypothetical protein